MCRMQSGSGCLEFTLTCLAHFGSFVCSGTDGRDARSKYDLVANLCHEGKAGEGSYRVHIQRKVEGIWYEVQDLRVIDYLPQMVVLSETYMQVWELKDS